MELPLGFDYDEYELPEPPDEIIDAAIMAAYQDTLDHPPTPEEQARFAVGLRKLIDMFTKDGGTQGCQNGAV